MCNLAFLHESVGHAVHNTAHNAMQHRFLKLINLLVFMILCINGLKFTLMFIDSEFVNHTDFQWKVQVLATRIDAKAKSAFRRFWRVGIRIILSGSDQITKT